jgi:hypothetical protein
MYRLPLPADTGGVEAQAQQLVMLVRVKKPKTTKQPVLYGSVCTLDVARGGKSAASGRARAAAVAPAATGDQEHGLCVAGTGGFEYETPAAAEPAELAAADWLNDGGVAQCNWSVPVPTNIQDAPSRTCAGALPSGGIWVLGNQGGVGRDPLTVSVAPDGIGFDRAYVLAHHAPPVRFPGRAKGPGFQYPSGMWFKDRAFATYSVGKEDIVVTHFELANLGDSTSRQSGPDMIV